VHTVIGRLTISFLPLYTYKYLYIPILGDGDGYTPDCVFISTGCWLEEAIVFDFVLGKQCERTTSLGIHTVVELVLVVVERGVFLGYRWLVG
jgi:hypothetical protein